MREISWLGAMLVVVGACGGGSTPATDAGGNGGNDAYVSPSDDAWVAPGDDAWSAPTDDAWVAPMDDAGSTGSGACTNTSDEAVTNDGTFSDDLGNCAMMHAVQPEPALMNCIVGLGLSSECAGCFDQQVHCTVQNCAFQCAGGDSPQCTMCRANHCDATFSACAGFTP